MASSASPASAASSPTEPQFRARVFVTRDIDSSPLFSKTKAALEGLPLISSVALPFNYKQTLIEGSSKETLEAREYYARTIVRDDAMCSGLEKEYVDWSIRNDSTNVLVVLLTRLTGKVAGFATVQLSDVPSTKNPSARVQKFYADVICAKPIEEKNETGEIRVLKGAGKMLISILRKLGKAYGRPNLTLKSVTNALGFYTHMGFECGNQGLCPMKLDLRTGGRRRYTRKRHPTRKHSTRRRR